MLRNRAGLLWSIAVIAVIAILLVIFVTSQGSGPRATEREVYLQQLDALSHVHDQGKQASLSLHAKGLHTSKGMCGEMFDATDASDGLRWQDPEFIAKARQYFINGCLGVPRPG